MLKSKPVVILVLILVIVLSGSAVYGQRGITWLQENLLPQPKEKPLTVTGKVSNGKIVLQWETEQEGITAFAVVMSRSNGEPRYPEDGYLCFLDPALRSYKVDLDLVYQGGDVDGMLIMGETYHFSVTALLGGRSLPGNSVALQVPKAIAEEKDKTDEKPEDPKEDVAEKPKDTTPKTPKPSNPEPVKPKPVDPAPKDPDPTPNPEEQVCRAWVKNDIIKMDWTKASGSDFQGYKVVISDTNKTPSYPGDGYLYWITNKDQNYAIVDNQNPYNGGSINGYLQAGKTYYFAVTYVYKDKKITTPAVKLTTPQTFPQPDLIEYVKPVITTILDEGNAVDFNIQVHWTWGGDPANGFKGFKAEITDMETGKVTYQHLGSTPGFMTLYCDDSGKEPAIVPYRYYKVRIIAIYEGKLMYSDYTRQIRSFGDTC